MAVCTADPHCTGVGGCKCCPQGKNGCCPNLPAFLTAAVTGLGDNLNVTLTWNPATCEWEGNFLSNCGAGGQRIWICFSCNINPFNSALDFGIAFACQNGLCCFSTGSVPRLRQCNPPSFTWQVVNTSDPVCIAGCNGNWNITIT